MILCADLEVWLRLLDGLVSMCIFPTFSQQRQHTFQTRLSIGLCTTLERTSIIIYHSLRYVLDETSCWNMPSKHTLKNAHNEPGIDTDPQLGLVTVIFIVTFKRDDRMHVVSVDVCHLCDESSAFLFLWCRYISDNIY